MNYIKKYYSAAVGNAVCINQNNHVKQTIFLFFSLVGNITHDITLQTMQNCKTFSLKQPVNTIFIQNLNDANVSPFKCTYFYILLHFHYRAECFIFHGNIFIFLCLKSNASYVQSLKKRDTISTTFSPLKKIIIINSILLT